MQFQEGDSLGDEFEFVADGEEDEEQTSSW
jgi:hypothetical protein